MAQYRSMFFLSAVVLTGCMKHQLQDPVHYLPNQIWREVCPGSNPEVTWLRLRSDGIFDYAYDSVEEGNWREGDNERWLVAGTDLVVSWNDGFAVTRYNLLAADHGVIPGETSKSCGGRITLQREPLKRGWPPAR